MGYSDSEGDSDYDSESDDEEMAYDQRRGKSSGKHYILFYCPVI
jgi:FK506-binding nuclear protein